MGGFPTRHTQVYVAHKLPLEKTLLGAGRCNWISDVPAYLHRSGRPSRDVAYHSQSRGVASLVLAKVPHTTHGTMPSMEVGIVARCVCVGLGFRGFW